MPPKIKVVADTNVYIAAALNKGYCYEWLFGAGSPAATYELFTSEEILSELLSKLTNKFRFSKEDAVGYINSLDRVLHKVRARQTVVAVRDPKDNMILECALEAEANLVITFDKDLLSLKNYESTQIAHPRVTQYWFPKQLPDA